VKVVVLSSQDVLFEGAARSVFLPGDLAEFELLDYHAPILSMLRRGDVVIDGRARIAIERGMVKFDQNECTVLVEEPLDQIAEPDAAVDSAVS
jgi:F-type H+-transporting ATPase subunit epsilon